MTNPPQIDRPSGSGARGAASNATRLPLRDLVGRSAAFMRFLETLRLIARYDAPVLMIGETGTGKELAARALHYASARAGGPFVPLNCGAIPDSLIEAELFGCERGAFTDARHGRAGLATFANGGTLFLDEVDSLSPRAQVTLLRFLQDKSFRPVGSTQERRSDVRVIAASGPRLRALVQEGSFRDDLAFRLGVMVIELPPLRERAGDVELLAAHFVSCHAREFDVTPRPLDTASLDWADGYAWPGNVRELGNVVLRALLLTDGAPLQLQPFIGSLASALAITPAAPSPDTAAPASYRLAREQALHDFERHYLTRLMRAAAGNVTHAARLAGQERRALGKLLKKHGLERQRFAPSE